MLYNELFEAWKREKETEDLQKLSKNFYHMLADYTRKLREESRMLDPKTTKAKLLTQESGKTNKMIKELVMIRRQKAVRKTVSGELVPSESLTHEEETLLKTITSPFESYEALLKDILNGRLPQSEGKEKPKKQVLRFLKDIPAIIGADMKTYGPFKAEDVASVPQANAKVLVKQSIAVEVEVKL
jgi:DNA replication factor GINS